MGKTSKHLCNVQKGKKNYSIKWGSPDISFQFEGTSCYPNGIIAQGNKSFSFSSNFQYEVWIRVIRRKIP